MSVSTGMDWEKNKMYLQLLTTTSIHINSVIMLPISALITMTIWCLISSPTISAYPMGLRTDGITFRLNVAISLMQNYMTTLAYRKQDAHSTVK